MRVFSSQFEPISNSISDHGDDERISEESQILIATGKSAANAIKAFQEAAVKGERLRFCGIIPIERDSTMSKMSEFGATAGLGLGLLSLLFSAPVESVIIGGKIEVFKILEALGKKIRQYVIENRDQPWARAIFDSLGDRRNDFTNLHRFITVIKVVCSTQTILGIDTESFELNLNTDSFQDPADAVMLISYCSHVFTMLGSGTIECWGWRTSPISLLDISTLKHHMSTLEEIKRRRLLDQDEDEGKDADIEDFTNENIEQAISDGKSLFKKQRNSYLHNMTYLAGWAAMGVAYWQIYQLALYRPKDYQYDTFERFQVIPDTCLDRAAFPLNMTFNNLPINGAVDYLHNRTISYPNSSIYDTIGDVYKASLLVPLVIPTMILMGKVPGVVKSIALGAKTAIVCIARNIFGWNANQENDRGDIEEGEEINLNEIELDCPS